MSFRKTDDLCPSWWEILAPLCLLGAEGEMIAADWKHGIFQKKARSRPRDNVTNRGASMARGVTVRPQEALFHCVKSLSPWPEMVCLSVSESCYFCALTSHQKCVFALWSPQEARVLGREKHAHMVAECKASRIILCHRPPNRGPTDRQRVQDCRVHVWKSFVGRGSSQVMHMPYCRQRTTRFMSEYFMIIYKSNN